MALVVRRGCAPIMELVNVHLAGKVDMRAFTYGALNQVLVVHVTPHPLMGPLPPVAPHEVQYQ